MKVLQNLFIVLAIITVSCNNNSNQQNKVSESLIEDKDCIKVQPPSTLRSEITIENIPSKAKEFISKNYTDYSISGVAYDPLCNGGDAMDVTIIHSEKPNYSLIFLPDGTFVQQEEDVKITYAPANVVKIVKEKYADYAIANQIEKLILADKSVQYLFDITKGKEAREVIFKVDGTLVCETKE